MQGLQFGEQVAGYDVRVLNEREIRAAAGILFLLALIAFMHAWLLGNFQWTRLFIVGFVLDFTIRLLLNPRYAPSMVLGRFMVRQQRPEYVGAAQKRFAWWLGYALALPMLVLTVFQQHIGPLNLLICLTCLGLLFFETAFGICIGCLLYKRFKPQQSTYCVGQSCETTRSTHLQLSLAQWTSVIALSILLVFINPYLSQNPARSSTTPAVSNMPNNLPSNPKPTTENCTPPDWAVKMGHADMWKMHHGCQ